MTPEMWQVLTVLVYVLVALLAIAILVVVAFFGLVVSSARRIMRERGESFDEFRQHRAKANERAKDPLSVGRREPKPVKLN